jgi:hypothetical protein
MPRHGPGGLSRGIYRRVPAGLALDSACSATQPLEAESVHVGLLIPRNR